MLEPSDFGFPDTLFPSYFPNQEEALEMVLNSPKRFVALGKPTGSGKSLVAATLAKKLGAQQGNVPILTSTKGLQKQYMDDFSACGLEVVYGKSNYTCREHDTSCRFGLYAGCTAVKDRSCEYMEARETALDSAYYTANYAWWFKANERLNENTVTPAQRASALILDEGDRAFDELSRAVQVEIKEAWLLSAGVRGVEPTDDLTYWRGLADIALTPLRSQLAETANEYKRHFVPRPASLRHKLYELEELVQGLERVRGYTDKFWVCEMREGTEWGRTWVFDCIWPGALAESRLWLGIKKIVVMSATLRPHDLLMLGVRADDFEFKEWPRVFKAVNSPVYYVPTVRMRWGMPDDELQKWVRRIDEIIELRLGRKGIIHTVSFDRQRYLLQHSRFSRYFYVNRSGSDTESAALVAERFKEADAPAILVSPSYDTGYDFPGDLCRWQIIGKIAFPETKSKIMAKRKALSENYINGIAMRNFIQSCGRSTRREDDWSECFVVDDSVESFFRRNKRLAPSWFNVVYSQRVPPPMRDRQAKGVK